MDGGMATDTLAMSNRSRVRTGGMVIVHTFPAIVGARQSFTTRHTLITTRHKSSGIDVTSMFNQGTTTSIAPVIGITKQPAD